MQTTISSICDAIPIQRTSEGDDTPRWFALQVTSGKEKLASQFLRLRGYEEFLPLYCDARQWSDRVKRIESPLFPGYLFCRCVWHATIKAVDAPSIISTPGVIRIVGVGRSPMPIDDWEVANVRILAQSGLQAKPCSFPAAGQKVRLSNGPLRGVEGLVQQTLNESRIVVSLSLLQRSISVTIDRSWVEAL